MAAKILTVHDPGGLEVLKNALESIVDSMAVTIARTARSAVLRQGLDFSTALLTARGEMLVQGSGIPVHLGGMPVALEACLKQYEGRIEPGDILCSNDPYEGGSHLPDIFIYKPIFVEERVFAYACAMSHHTDIGGRVAGGNATDSTEIYQEGLRIPPLKLYEKGVPNETLFRILEKAVRVPEMVLGDLLSNISAIHIGEREFLKLLERYGVEEMEGAMERLLDYTEQLTREVIRTLPDGAWTFTDYIDDDGLDPGPIAIVSNLRKEGDQIAVDFSGTSPQSKGAINPVIATTRAMVYAVFKSVLGALGYDIPNNQGYLRSIEVTAPLGCFVNPVSPAPVNARGMSLQRTSQSVFGVFAQMLPELIPACSGGAEVGVSMSGYDRTKRPWTPWVLMDFHMETARGGAAMLDGLDAHSSGTNHIANVPAEILELDYPVKVIQYGFVQDSEGAGKHRGGLGMTREWEYQMDETTVQVRSDRQKHTPYGLYGGQASRPAEVVFNPDTPEETKMPSKFMLSSKQGDRLRMMWCGAGGWGDPLERDPQLVLEDVIEQKVSVQRAQEVYGVVVDLQNGRVDTEATERLLK